MLLRNARNRLLSDDDNDGDNNNNNIILYIPANGLSPGGSGYYACTSILNKDAA